MDIPIGSPKDMTSMREQPPPPPEIKKEKVPEKLKEVPKKKEKKPWTKKKKIIAIAIVVIILLPFIILGIVYHLPAEVKSIDIILSKSNPDDITLYLEVGIMVHTTTLSSARGDAKYTITYNEKEVGDGKILVDGNTGHTLIPYSNFVEENGNYIIEVRFSGVSASYEFQVKEVIETVGIRTYLTEDEKKFKVDLTFLDNRNAEIKIIHKGENETPEVKYLNWTPALTLNDVYANIKITNLDKNLQIENRRVNVSKKIMHTEFFDHKESGNYSVKVEIENKNVRTDSEFRNVVSKNSTLLNARPIAFLTAKDDKGNEVNDGDSVRRGADGKVTITFDGRNSKDDGKIVIYHWEIYEENPTKLIKTENTTEGTFSYTFDKDGKYAGVLIVKDNYNAWSNRPDIRFTVVF